MKLSLSKLFEEMLEALGLISVSHNFLWLGIDGAFIDYRKDTRISCHFMNEILGVYTRDSSRRK